MARLAKIYRKTTETEILLEVNLDGKGAGDISTSIPFMDHMLNLFAKHSGCDLSVKSAGDTEIDDHHLVEDLGICLGDAIKEALDDKKGIGRYGSATVPMDESLCNLAMDISGRPYLIYNVKLARKKIGQFDAALIKEFFKSFSDHSGITLHINLMYGTNGHHMAEAVFKAFARAFKEAVTVHEYIEGVLSTKGSL
ncbi:MAG: imidazoleglycerol-phosphate dehydratase HisB [Deltaproteobacteria bacterium]|nr:imidazoleglycerol-phosphate dehydratase HisB [Deltaproteobacteria bacterium]